VDLQTLLLVLLKNSKHGKVTIDGRQDGNKCRGLNASGLEWELAAISFW